jgi:beta-lactamase superfamily II metal-dependent hydrolase
VIDYVGPSSGEFEVSVFGRGFGEAICIHANDEWVLVDSCLNPETGESAALSYLAALDVPPSAVALVVITHWDDDHVSGISEVVRSCSEATVACSLALNRADIFEFVIEQERLRDGAGSGVDELRSVLRQCRGTGRLLWAKATLPLHPREAGGSPTAVALSPSDDAVMRSVESLIEEALQARISYPRRYRAPEGPNGASVAATVRCGENLILLGADLENSKNPESGWDAVLTYARPPFAASLVKVPHHGSEGAHHEEVWAKLVDDQAIAIVTPWVLGGGHLPKEDDLVRLRSVAGHVYLTAMPTLGRVRKDSAVEKMIAKVAGVRVEELRGWGQVRARRLPDEHAWRVDLAGDACEVA